MRARRVAVCVRMCAFVWVVLSARSPIDRERLPKIRLHLKLGSDSLWHGARGGVFSLLGPRSNGNHRSSDSERASGNRNDLGSDFRRTTAATNSIHLVFQARRGK